MRTRLWVALGLCLALAAPAAGCSSPYAGKPERLRKPKEKKRPEGDEAPAEVTDDTKPAEDQQCRTNFFAAPTKRRNARGARRLSDQADPILANAEHAEGDHKVGLLIDAIGKLSNALEKDPYAPVPTYKLAVAYAMAGRKSCALALLDRLKILQKHPDVERETQRTIQRAVRDPAFDPFRKEADKALGE